MTAPQLYIAHDWLHPEVAEMGYTKVDVLVDYHIASRMFFIRVGAYWGAQFAALVVATINTKAFGAEPSPLSHLRMQFLRRLGQEVMQRANHGPSWMKWVHVVNG